jgi:hypothetical protein
LNKEQSHSYFTRDVFTGDHKKKHMKSIFVEFSIALLFIILPAVVHACEITVSVEGAKKERYQPGDIVVVKITVQLEHRNCDVDLNETSIRVSGSQILGTTKWVNTEGRTWERKIKVKIMDDKTGKAEITAERTCEKDGGRGTLILKTG